MIMGELGCSEHKVQVHTGEDGCNHQKYGAYDPARLGLGVFYAKDEIRDPYKVGHHRQSADANKQRKAEQRIDKSHAPLRKEHLFQLFHPSPPRFSFSQHITVCINVQDRPQIVLRAVFCFVTLPALPQHPCRVCGASSF